MLPVEQDNLCSELAQRKYSHHCARKSKSALPAIVAVMFSRVAAGSLNTPKNVFRPLLIDKYGKSNHLRLANGLLIANVPRWRLAVLIAELLG